MKTVSRHNALPWLGLSVLVVALDQLSKAWVLARLPEFQPVPVIDASDPCQSNGCAISAKRACAMQRLEPGSLWTRC